MSVSLWTILLAFAAANGTVLSGQVLDAAGTPVASARVFLERGISGTLRETQTSADGKFTFQEVVPGPAGVFAVANGFAFMGRHLNVGFNEEIPPVEIRLRQPATIGGQVTAKKGGPVAGARITRVALLEAEKVSIPLTKLQAFGYPEPKTDANGRFIIEHLPEGGQVALKIGHPDFAQEGVERVAVGDANVRITLSPGVLTEGTVVQRQRQVALAGAEVLIQNAQPPHDSIVTTTDSRGRFVARLKPGKYLCQASSSGFRTPGWVSIEVPEGAPMGSVELPVAATGFVRGVLKDAVTEKPIAGARISLETQGRPAAATRTGATGEFRIEAAAGENVIRLEAAPGYFPPEVNTIGVAVAESQEAVLPALWLAPLPEFEVEVLDEHLAPAPGVAVRLLRPYQFGVFVTDSTGRVRIKVSVVPPGGRLIGVAEHPSQALGAVFALTRKDTQGARVQLLPLSHVHGRVVNAENRGLEGAIVGAFFPGETPEEELLLWRCVTRADGIFEWDAVVPGLPQRILARAGVSATGQSQTFNSAPHSENDLGGIVVNGGQGRTSLFGQTLSWAENELLAGTVPGAESRAGRATLLMYCEADEAAPAAEGLAQLLHLAGVERFNAALIVNGFFRKEGLPFPVLRGNAPGAARTYLLDRSGKVAIETFGLPPLRALQML